MDNEARNILTVDEIQKRYLTMPETWTCPLTNLRVPKRPAENLEYRRSLIIQAERDSGMRNALATAAKESLLFFTNTFGWTLRVKEVGSDGEVCQVKPQDAHTPWITWPVQDEHLLEIQKAVHVGFDLLSDKSRDMGATWDHLDVLFHDWLFLEGRSFLMLSAKEAYVDSPGKKGKGHPADPSTLFGKLDYLYDRLPAWLQPPMARTTLHMTNLSNNSRLDGESTTATAGSSERRTAILLDEMAKMPQGEDIKRSTRDVTACRLANSTPNGPATAFSKWRFDGSIRVFTLGWWCHPEKGKGLSTIKDDVTGLDKYTSPWYAHEKSIRSPKELAIEIDIDHLGSGETYFEKLVLQKAKQSALSFPIRRRNTHIRFGAMPLTRVPEVIRGNQVEFVEISTIPHGPWTFWMPLVENRPDQGLNYIFAIDIGKGMGASNSVISVGCLETHKKIAEWASAQYAPHEFAQIVAASAVWFGGSARGQRPLIIWEANGDPGIYFGRALVRDFRYPHLYFDKSASMKIKPGKPRHYGWHSSTEKKAEVIGDYRRALAQGTFINPSVAALTEAESWVYMDNGDIGPAFLQRESSSARKTHGDRVIADALLNLAMGRPRLHGQSPMPVIKSSFAQRYEEWQRGQKRRNRRWNLRVSA